MADKHGILRFARADIKQPKVVNPVKIQDLTFRDGHQSLFATRGRTEDLVQIAEMVDEVGFYSMEVWGGATFDAMHRYLAEDPWERLDTLKKYIKKTPFSMLIRGQNLVGYRNYADDVAEAFVDRAAEHGVDIFRVFDALNDFRNFETVVRVIKEKGKHFQGSICYTLTQPRMGGEVYSLEYYLAKAKDLEKMGADSICIKDMAGLISPYDAYTLVRALKKTVKPPIHLHSHFTSGMSDMAMLKAIEAGVDIIDTVLAPWAYRTSHPAVEPLAMALKGTSRDPDFDIGFLSKIDAKLEELTIKYRHLLDDTKVSVIDINVLLHQTPGGMLSNLVNQLREMDALDKLDEVFRQLPTVRAELGQVPLVTPTSQIVGTQTVNNVLFDTEDERYKMITAQVKDLLYGLYGETPRPVDKKVQKKALQGYPRGKKPITCRPADILDPELDDAKKTAKKLATTLEETLIVALYPTTGVRFLKWKHGKENVPENAKPRTIDKAKEEQKLVELARQGLATPTPTPRPDKGPDSRTYNVFVGGEHYEIEVEEVYTGKRPIERQNNTTNRVTKSPSTDKIKTKSHAKSADGGTTIAAPMPGMIISHKVKKGDKVKEGDTVLILEAMKMENHITAPVAGKVKELPFKDGESVQKDDLLAVIG